MTPKLRKRLVAAVQYIKQEQLEQDRIYVWAFSCAPVQLCVTGVFEDNAKWLALIPPVYKTTTMGYHLRLKEHELSNRWTIRIW